MKTILVVDDDPVYREITCSHLREGGFGFESVWNGRYALEMLAAKQIDLVVTDNQMPLMSGLDLIRAIKEHPHLAHIPTILFTGVPDPHILRQAESLGVFRTFFKPFPFAQLLQAIHAALAGSANTNPQKPED